MPDSTALTARSFPLGPGRVEEAEPRAPAYTPLLLLLGLLYVVLALAFGARLLDVIGTSLDEEQLGALRFWSQALCAGALALALYGSCILPLLDGRQIAAHWRGLAHIGALLGVIAIAIGAHQGALAWIIQDPTGLRARKAVQLDLLAHAALDGGMLVPELYLAPALLGGSAGKSFLALLLISALTDDQNAGPAPDRLRQAMQMLAAQRVGSAAQVYDNIFVPSVRSLKDANNAYVAAQVALAEDVKTIHEQQTQAWAEYVEGLTKRGLSLTKLTRADWAAIATDVRQGGVAVPADWNPADQAGFVLAFSTPRRQAANGQYRDRLQRLFGAELPPGLEWEQFHAHPIVQTRWRAAIQAPEAVSLSPNMGFAAFEEAVYRPMIMRLIQPKLDILLAPQARFAPSAELAAMGNLAARQIALPAIALILALAGVVWHGCTLLSGATRLLIPHWPGRRRTLALALCIGAVFVLGARGPVARADGFQRWQDQIADRAGPVWLATLGMVEAFALLHPPGDMLRRNLLSNQDFGLDAFARPREHPGAQPQTLLDPP